jgi:osmotically-inducible protein OsmY
LIFVNAEIFGRHRIFQRSQGRFSVKDENLRQQVVDELRSDPAVGGEKIDVAVVDGVVSLSGHVSSCARRVAAERIVRRLTNVRGVTVAIDIKLPQGAAVPDDEIAQRAVTILKWNSLLPADRIQVSVKDGWITLSGEVDWQYQRSAAEDAVRPLPGVVAVVNNLSSRSQVHVEHVRNRIENVLTRIAAARAARISVAVCGPIVTIHGKVHDQEERAAVKNAVELIPGVQHVEDLLTVG